MKVWVWDILSHSIVAFNCRIRFSSESFFFFWTRVASLFWGGPSIICNLTSPFFFFFSQAHISRMSDGIIAIARWLHCIVIIYLRIKYGLYSLKIMGNKW